MHIIKKLLLTSCVIAASGCGGAGKVNPEETSSATSSSVVVVSSISMPSSSSSQAPVVSSSSFSSSSLSSRLPSSQSSVAPSSSSIPSSASPSSSSVAQSSSVAPPVSSSSQASSSSVVGLVTSYNFDQDNFRVGAEPAGFSSLQFAEVSDEQAFSGSKSVKLSDNSNDFSSNLRLIIGDTDSGRLRASVFITEDPKTDVYLTAYSGDWKADRKVVEILIKPDGRVVKREPLNNGTGKYDQGNLISPDQATTVVLGQWNEFDLDWQDVSSKGEFNVSINASKIATAQAVNAELVPDRVEIRFGVNDNKGETFGNAYIDDFYVRLDGATTGGKQGLPVFTSTLQKVGYFVDAPVAGIGYETDSAGIAETGDDGSFVYSEGEDITFFIGDLRFPSTKAKATITPLDIANTKQVNNQLVTNIARLLQSLDDDNDTSTGIRIKSSAANAATQINLRAGNAAFESAIAPLMRATNSQLKSVDAARSSLDTDLKRLVNKYALVSADGAGGKSVLELFAQEFGRAPIEHQDCRGLQISDRIKEVNDSDLNTSVFRFIMNLNDDKDCSTTNATRQRLEVKTYGSSPESTKGREGEWHTYQWKFKLDSGFKVSSKFTHIFQMKAVGGDEKSPILTLTPRKGNPDQLQLIYNNAGSNDVTVLRENLSLFKGKWVTAYVRAKYNDNNGFLEVILRETLTGNTLMSYVNNNIDLFRDNSDFVRPKWGIYRDKANAGDLRNENVLFNDFCVAEGTNVCPE